jgi:hypothetical protein
MSSQSLDLVYYDPKSNPHSENWLIDDLLTIPSTTILASPPKVGKTVLATTLAVAVATGQPFLGRPTVQGPVLWFASEETHAERRRLMDQIPYPEGPYPFPAMPENGIHSDRALPIYTCYTRITIDNEFFYREINEATISVKPKLIVLDPLINFAGNSTWPTIDPPAKLSKPSATSPPSTKSPSSPCTTPETCAIAPTPSN